MSFTLNYTKTQYQTKITELDGYYKRLSTHLTTMESLKDRMYQFWTDENARTTGKMLEIEIRQVKNSMERTQDLLQFYKTSVEKLDGTNQTISDTLGDALKILTGLGI